MLALIAGTGDLPPVLIARLDIKPLVCALQGFKPAIPPDLTFRLEHLGSFLATLKEKGVTQICMAGAVRRPDIDPTQIDAATLPLLPKVQAAMVQGDDGALRAIIALLEDAGFVIVAAHELAPDLLPAAGVPTTVSPHSRNRAEAQLGEAAIAELGRADAGQACVVSQGQVVATEGPEGTDDMLALIKSFSGGILFKATKPGQDRRADLPVIGQNTVAGAAKRGLAGIVIEAGGVMVLDQFVVIDTLNANGMFLWVRRKGAA